VGGVDALACVDAEYFTFKVDMDEKVRAEAFVRKLKDIQCSLEAL